MKHFLSLILIFFALHCFTQNVVIVIIDGARYSETFGDANKAYIPHMANLATQGTLINTFYNDSATYTSAAIPAIWCGTWTNTIDTIINGANTQYAEKPSLFEYFRKQKEMPETKCIYTLKYVPSLWLPSFNANYGPNYWPYIISDGTTDKQVLENTLDALNQYHPQFMIAYFADVDHFGHTGIWNNYVSAIKNADSCVNELWNSLQNDPFYKGNTTMLVVNDHGRHDDQNGGFRGHGCSCNGCRQIMFLALGPNIKKNFISDIPRRLPDVAVTAASILKVNPEFASGAIANEIFTTTGTTTLTQNIKYTITAENILIDKTSVTNIHIRVFSTDGKLVFYNRVNAGVNKIVHWNNGLKKGIYIVSITDNNQKYTEKIWLK